MRIVSNFGDEFEANWSIVYVSITYNLFLIFILFLILN